MATTRKTADNRIKDLRLAIHRIEQGRAITKATVVSITTVANEAGVSTALIYNHYPKIAETIRDKQGKSSRAQRDSKVQELKSARLQMKALRAELKVAKDCSRKLASLNEMHLSELHILRAQVAGSSVTAITGSAVSGYSGRP